MHTALCDQLGIEFPIFAFSHCRDVVAAVSRAGGFGVLGAVGFTPEQLEIELKWIDEHVGDRPYGIDTVIPHKYEGMGELDPDKLEAMLEAAIPEEHRRFVAKILADHGVPELPPDEKPRELIGWTAATGKPQVDVALRHERVRLVANALGTPPEDVIAEIHEAGRLVAALSGSVKHAIRHRDAGVDIIIAQGYEGGGHTGEVASLVLWPQVIDAVAPTPVLAAGGIGNGRQIAAALAMGAQGVWLGSIWLTTTESDWPEPHKESLLEATSADTVRSRSLSGKPARMLRNDWTEAWERPDAPKPLPLPLQGMVTLEAMARCHRYAKQAKKVAINPVGQVVGQMNQVRSCRQVIMDLVREYLDAVEHLQSLTPQIDSD
ncbi:MAG: nitronate monooxygenase [Candidatus Dadabacteria bacterium]|nr:MAG: nitronate monooxygenase [Candidatus Dadabacteria bacterium]